MNIQAKKIRVDVQGAITEAPMNDLIEIGVFSGNADVTGKALHLKKYRIHSGSNQRYYH